MLGNCSFDVRRVGPLLRYRSRPLEVEIDGKTYCSLHSFRAQHRRFAGVCTEELENILRSHPEAHDGAGRPRYDFRFEGGVLYLRCPPRAERECRDYGLEASMASASASALVKPGLGAGEPMRAELPGGAWCCRDVGTSADEVARFSPKSSKSEIASPEGDSGQPPSAAMEQSRPARGANVPVQGLRSTFDFEGAAPPPPMLDVCEPQYLSPSSASGGQLPLLGVPSAARAAPCPLNDLD